MRPSALALSLFTAASGLAGCAARPQSPRYIAPASPIPIVEARAYEEKIPGVAGDGPRGEQTVDVLRTSQDVYAVQQSRPGAQFSAVIGRALGGAQTQVRQAAPPAAIPIQGEGQPAKVEMLDIEARVSLEVARVSDAVAALRGLVAAQGGQVINDVLEDTASSAGAALSIRIPAEKTEAFLGALASLGRITSRKVSVRDIGKEFHDARLLQKNLEAALARYQELLARAQNAREMLDIEAEMARVRARLDRIKGDLIWMQDRAARSTFYVTLGAPRPEVVSMDPRVFPGVRGVGLIELDARAEARGLAGVGLSVMASRHLHVSMDLLRRTGDTSGGGLDGFLLVAGADVYSELLGGGRRSWLNPYLGLRGGYSRLLGLSELALGAAVGVELYKTRSLLLDLGVQGLALFGTSHGAHAGFAPALGLNTAFLSLLLADELDELAEQDDRAAVLEVDPDDVRVLVDDAADPPARASRVADEDHGPRGRRDVARDPGFPGLAWGACGLGLGGRGGDRGAGRGVGAEHDQPVGRVGGRDGDPDAIAGLDPHPVATHPPREDGADHGTGVLGLHGECPVGERLAHGSFEFQEIKAGHGWGVYG